MSNTIQSLIRKYDAELRAEIKDGQTYFEVVTQVPNGGARAIADAIADNFEAHGVPTEIVGDNLSATIMPIHVKVTDQAIWDFIDGK